MYHFVLQRFSNYFINSLTKQEKQSKVATARFENVNASNKNLFCINIILSVSYVSIWKLEVKIRRYSGEYRLVHVHADMQIYILERKK